MSSLLQQQNGVLESLDSEYSIIADQPMVNGDVSEAANGHFDLHLALTSATPDMSLEELQSRLAEVVEDNISLKEALTKNNEMMHSQLNSITSWHSQITNTMSKQQMDLNEAQDKIKELEKENKGFIDKLKESEELKNRALRESMSPLTDEEVDFEIINRKELKKMVEESKLKEAEAKISNLIQVVESQKEEIEKLKTCYPVGEGEAYRKYKESKYCDVPPYELIQQFTLRVIDLKKSLAAESSAYQYEKNSHLETKKMFALVQTNYDRVTKLLQIQSRDERDKTSDDVERERDTRMYLEQIDQLTARLYDTEQRLQDEIEKVRALTSELTALKDDSETIPILKAQTEVYRMDLESATLARDAAKEEVSRLAQQLHNVGSICSLCDNCQSSMMVGGSHGKRRPSNTHKKLELTQEGDLYRCPVCNVGFVNIRLLEGHVNKCIDQSEKPH